MSTHVMDGALEQTAGTAGTRTVKPLTLIVGYDASEPAQHALERAISVLHERDGSLEVVFVAHLPATAAMSAQAVVEVQEGLDEEATNLACKVRGILAGSGIAWHFRRRNGIVGDELIAAADEQVRAQKSDSDITIIVGGSSHWYHHLGGSVASSIARHDRFPLLVQP